MGSGTPCGIGNQEKLQCSVRHCQIESGGYLRHKDTFHCNSTDLQVEQRMQRLRDCNHWQQLLVLSCMCLISTLGAQAQVLLVVVD